MSGGSEADACVAPAASVTMPARFLNRGWSMPMKRLAFVVVALSLAWLPAFADDKPDKKEEKLDPAKLVGKWEYVSGKKAGEDVPKDHLEGVVEWSKDEIKIPGGFVMGYKVDAAKTPAQIDMEVKEGPAPAGSKAVGIVGIKDGELRLCYTPQFGEKADRPDKF